MTDDSKTATTRGKKDARAVTGVADLTAAADWPGAKTLIDDTATITGTAAVLNAGMPFANEAIKADDSV